MKKILIAHPFKQHSFKLVEALNTDKRFKVIYATTVYDKNKSLMFLVKKIIKGDNLKKANSRKSDKIYDNQVILKSQVRGFLTLFINRFCPFNKITRFYQRRLYDKFGNKIYKMVKKEHFDIVIMFDTTATVAFRKIRKYNKNIKLIIDMSSTSLLYTKKIFDEEYSITNDKEIKKSKYFLWNKRIMSHLTEEFLYADHFICASNFVKKSLIYSGIAEDKITVIPYGIDLENYKNIKREPIKNSSKINFIYAGTIDYNKGVHRLLNVISNYGDYINMRLYGKYFKNSKIYIEYNKYDHIHFEGHVTRDKLVEAYRESDVFIFPSMNDGFGFVILEAMACKLPVICSKNAGAADLIDSAGGFTYNYENMDEMKQAIEWLLKNRNKFYAMGEYNYNKLLKYTWSNYNKQLISFINKL